MSTKLKTRDILKMRARELERDAASFAEKVAEFKEALADKKKSHASGDYQKREPL